MSGLTIALIASGFLLWYGTGVAGHAWWWTSQFDYEPTDLVLGLFIGLVFGPFTWVIGRLIHGKRTRAPRVLIGKRS